MSKQPLAVSVIASANRVAILEKTIKYVVSQNYPEHLVVVSVPDATSLPPGWVTTAHFRIVTGARGLTSQRNAALDYIRTVLPDTSYVFFFDDDIVLSNSYVREGVDFLEQKSEFGGITGYLLLDGVAEKREIEISEAEALLANGTRFGPPYTVAKDLYGCNFGFRFYKHRSIGFDEELPSYGWLEDLDFSKRLKRDTQLAELRGCVAVHLGANSGGRTNHVKIGYSQVANALHLWRKRSITLSELMAMLARPVFRNVVGALIGAQRDWRRERLRGNGKAAFDALRNKAHPKNILSL